MSTQPIPVVRQHRPVKVREFTSGKPGRIMPVTTFGLLRGDSCSGRLNIGIEANETHELLYNKLHARVSSWFVPEVANDRFKRNRTYFERAAQGKAVTDEPGAAVIPFIETHPFPAVASSHAIYKHLGLSHKAGTAVSTCYQEGYNQIVNYMYRQRSKSLPQRELTDSSLAYALWGANSMTEIVPDFDDGMIAGELSLTVTEASLPVTAGGLSVNFRGRTSGKNTGLQVNGGAAPNRDVTTVATDLVASETLTLAPVSNMYAALSPNGISVSLANIDQAKNLKEWAKYRERFEGHKDPYVIDTLMSGLPVDDQVWYQPMLLDMQMLEIDQAKRMASDYDNMENGMTNGAARGTIGVNVPPNPFGGIVMVLVEFFPEQLYERQADPKWTTIDRDKLPQYDRDVMNPMPVVEVKNGEVDVAHNAPNVRFGYARRNWMWANNGSRCGGDLYAPNADAATGIARRPIYATDVANPTLSEEFYLTKTLGREVFVDQVVDPFKIGVGGMLDVMGLTVIGEVHESEANYDIVRAKYPPLQTEA